MKQVHGTTRTWQRMQIHADGILLSKIIITSVFCSKGGKCPVPKFKGGGGFQIQGGMVGKFILKIGKTRYKWIPSRGKRTSKELPVPPYINPEQIVWCKLYLHQHHKSTIKYMFNQVKFNNRPTHI